MAFAGDCTQIGVPGAILQKEVLSQRVAESLEADSSGGKIVEGLFVPPTGLLESIRAGDPSVTTVAELPAYILTLEKGPMDDTLYTLTRVCHGKVDTRQGFVRPPTHGEMGYKKNGKTILAENCWNTPMGQTPVAPKPAPIADLVFGNVTEVTRRSAECSKNMIFHIWQSAALDVSTNVNGETVTARSLIGNRQGSEGQKAGTSYDSHVSALFGGTFRKMNQEGSLAYDTGSHDVRIALFRKGQKDGALLYEGPMQSTLKIAAPASYNKTTDTIKWYFANDTEVAYPAYIGLTITELPFCDTNFHAIVAEPAQLGQPAQEAVAAQP